MFGLGFWVGGGWANNRRNARREFVSRLLEFWQEFFLVAKCNLAIPLGPYPPGISCSDVVELFMVLWKTSLVNINKK